MITAARPPYTVPLAHGRALTLGSRCLVMGIVNVTPDSFAETTPRNAAAAIDAALAMESEGADLIDIGGESTRPGAQPVPVDQELARVLPVVRGLAGRLTVPISIDTYKATVAHAALAEGAALVNDVSGLRYDPSLAAVAAAADAGIILMHMRGRPAAMYSEADYRDVVGEVAAELQDAIDRATFQGVARDRVIVDPGIGFAKRAGHSYGVLAHLADIGEVLGRPILAGPSRKSFMREALGDRLAAARDWGTAAAVTAAVLGGAHIVRVHAVPEMMQVVRVAEEIRRSA